MIKAYPKPSGAPDAGWSVTVNSEPTWTHYTGRGAVATYSTDAVDAVAVVLTAPVAVTAAEVEVHQDGVWPPPAITANRSGNQVVFVLPAGFYGHAVVRINNALPSAGWQSFCTIGVLPLETDVPSVGSVTYYFGAGVHTGAQIDLQSNQTVYVAPGALVKRRIVSGQVGNNSTSQRSNVRIWGRGVIDTTDGYGPTDQGLGSGDFAGVNGLSIEGVTYVSRYTWALAIYRCTNFLLDRARVFSCEVVNAADYSAEGTPDGVDVIACQGVTIRRSAISAADDSSAIKANKYGMIGDCSNHLYEDLLLVQGGKSNTTEIGYELGTQSVTNVTYRRVYAPISWRDSVSYRTNLFGIHLVSGATVDGVLYEDCRADEARNKDYDLFLSNFYFSGGFGSVSGDANRGYLRNITYRRVDFPGTKPVRITADLTDPTIEGGAKKVTNVTFDSCTRGGAPLTAIGGDWTVTNVVNLQFSAVSEPEPGPSSMILGVNWHAAWSFQRDAAVRGVILDEMAAWGAKSVRLDYAWASFEPTKGQFQWGQLDGYIGEAAQRGLSVLLMVYWAPSWSSGTTAKNGIPGTVGTDPSPAKNLEDGYKDYGRALGAVGKRYGSKLAGVEMWNEPDLEGFWSGDVHQFRSMMLHAYGQAKPLSPSTTFICAAPTYIGLASYWYPQLYQYSWFEPGHLEGATWVGCFDAVACHPYMAPANLPPDAPATNWSIKGIADLQALRISKGDTTPLWVTEFGWSTHANAGGEEPYKLGVTEAEQATFTAQAFSMFNSMGIAGVYLYTDVDMAQTADPQERNFGVLRTDYSRKPVFQALADLNLTTAPPVPIPPGSLPPNLPPDPVLWPPDPPDPTDHPITIAPDPTDIHRVLFHPTNVASTALREPLYPPKPVSRVPPPLLDLTWDTYPDDYTWDDHPADLTWENLLTLKELEA